MKLLIHLCQLLFQLLHFCRHLHLLVTMQFLILFRKINNSKQFSLHWCQGRDKIFVCRIVVNVMICVAYQSFAMYILGNVIKFSSHTVLSYLLNNENRPINTISLASKGIDLKVFKCKNLSFKYSGFHITSLMLYLCCVSTKIDVII